MIRPTRPARAAVAMLLMTLAALAALACTRDIVVLDSLDDDYCPADSSPDGTAGCEAGRCPATPSCAIDDDRD